MSNYIKLFLNVIIHEKMYDLKISPPDDKEAGGKL
jgi:hypothetical protein